MTSKHTPPVEPESGFERVQWLIDNTLYVEDDKLKTVN